MTKRGRDKKSAGKENGGTATKRRSRVSPGANGKRGAFVRQPTARRIFTLAEIEDFFNKLTAECQEEKDPRKRMLLCRDQQMFAVMFAFGLRTSELAGLNLDSFEPDPGGGSGSGGLGTVRIALRGMRGSGSRHRIVLAMGSYGPAAIQRYLSEVRPLLADGTVDQRALFLSARGNHVSPNSVNKRFRRAATAAGIGDPGFTPRSLRHALMSHLVASGIPRHVIARFFGYRNRVDGPHAGDVGGHV